MMENSYGRTITRWRNTLMESQWSISIQEP